MTLKRVLLDENLSPTLRERLALTGHSVVTARYRGWDGKKNGELIALAEIDGFDVLVTRDRNLRYQQNMNVRRIALVVVIIQKSALQSRAARKRDRQEHIILENSERVLVAINATKVNDYIEVVLEPLPL